MKFPWSKKDASASVVSTSGDEARAVDVFVTALRKLLKGSDWDSEAVLGRLAKSDPELFDQVAGTNGEARGRTAIRLLRKVSEVSSSLNGSFYKDYVERMRLQEALMQLAGRLASTKGAVSVGLFPSFVEAWTASSKYTVSYARIAGVAEYLIPENGLTPGIVDTLRPLLQKLEAPQPTPHTAEQRRQAARLRKILYPANSTKIDLPQPWQAPFRDPAWAKLLEHASNAKATQMPPKWAATARQLLEAEGTERYLDAFESAVDAVCKMSEPVDPLHSDMLRGLGWIAGLGGSERAAALLGRLVIGSGHKLVNFGARSQKGFSGAVGSLEAMGTFEALAQLSNSRNRIKTPSLSEALTAALQRAAKKQQLPLEDLVELVVPTHGLELAGIRLEALGAVEARLEVSGSCDVQLRWFRNGAEVKSPPEEVKREHASELKELQAAAKEMKTALAAQKTRVEGMMLTGRTLAYPGWRERYADHPLLARMSRLLVWRFANSNGERLGIPLDGLPLDIEGNPLEDLGAGTTVRLWHPIEAGVSAIEAWREFLVSREISQPFKQAYREIYILTAAEEATHTYSNRFAAHVLKQHQMNALARSRGWRYALQGYFDGSNNPTLGLPQWGLEAEYFVQVAEMEQPVSDFGIALYVSTDQVRFTDPIQGVPVPLEQIPPVVFSEVLRDVDLFVGVASVGNDPSWADQGEQFGMGAYWRKVAFGDLSATAETRKAVLQRLLPRLAIANVSKLDGKFLVVKGKRRTYKIHLGSGNILMLPNDQYLCIVPSSLKGSSMDRVYLPFEGDGVLAIILSKAFMLANDDKIADPTITRQL